MDRNPLIFLSAGEASGDHYGAELISRLREALPAARFTGLGGLGMQAAGQQRVVRAEDVAVMGITEILRQIPRILRRYRALVRSIYVERPDIAVLIDFPDVNFRLAKHLKRMDVPVIWFVSPQLWAWKRRRLRWVQQRVDEMLTIFPFEETFYRARGVKARFAGHPLAEMALPVVSREEFAAASTAVGSAGPEQTLDVARRWIALLPGSRWKEVAANLPVMLEAAALLGPGYHFLLPVASTLDVDRVRGFAFQLVRSINHLPASSLALVTDARAALLHSRAAVVASGTATVQAAVLGTPFVAVYRVSGMTFALAKQLVRYPAEIVAMPDAFGNLPIVMPNLIAGRRVVPELLQERFTAENLLRELRPLLEDGPARSVQLAGLAAIRQALLHPDGGSATERLRDTVLRTLGCLPASSGASASASNA